MTELATRRRPARFALLAALAVVGVLCDLASPSSLGGVIGELEQLPLMLLAVFFAMVVDQGGARTPFAILGVLWLATGVASAIPGGIGQYAAGLAGALAAVCYFPLAARALVPWTPRPERTRALGVYWSVVWLAPFALSPLIRLAATAGGDALSQPSGRSVVYSALAACGLFVLARWYRDDPRDHASVSAAERALIGDVADVAQARADQPLIGVLRLPETWMLAIHAGLLTIAVPALFEAASALDGADAPGQRGMILIVIAGAAGAIAAPFAERAIARSSASLAHARARLSIRATLAAAVALLVCTALLNAPIRGDTAFSAALLVLGVAVAAVAGAFGVRMVMPVLWATCADIGGKYAATLTAIVAFGAGIGTVVGNQISGGGVAAVALLASAALFRFYVPSREVPLDDPDSGPLSPRSIRVLSLLCYVPLVQVLMLFRGIGHRAADVRFHAWQALVLWIPASFALMVLLRFTVLMEYRPRFLPILALVIAPLALSAYFRPAFRMPIVSWPLVWILEPRRARRKGAPITQDSVIARVIAGGVILFGVIAIVAASALPLQARTGTAMLMTIGAYAILLGRRMGARSAQRAMAAAAEAPVVYLRSFSIDDQSEGEKAKSRGAERLGARDEQILADLFSAVGPVVAVGRPDERLPQLGAARIYFSDDEWQPGVQSLIARASLVVLRVGNSPGFLWEVQRVVQTVDPTRVIFYFSHRLTDRELDAFYGAFVTLTAGVFPVALPETIHRERFLVFDASWTPRLTGSVPRTGWSIARLAAPPFGTHLVEQRVRTRLARAMRDWFSARGLTPYPAALFGRGSIALAAWLAGPAGAGALLIWNYVRTGRRALALWAVAGTAVLTFAHYMVSVRGFSVASTDEVRSTLAIVGMELFGFATFFALRWLMPGAMRVHFQIGGAVVPAWLTAALLLGMIIARYALFP